MYRRIVVTKVLTTYYVTSLNLLHPIGFVTVNDSFTSCTAMSLNVRRTRTYTMSTLTMMNMNAIAKWNIDLHVKQFPLQIIITSSLATATPPPSATISTASGRERYEWNEQANEKTYRVSFNPTIKWQFEHEH